MNRPLVVGLGLLVVGGLSGCERSPGSPGTSSQAAAASGSAGAANSPPLPADLTAALRGAGLETNGFVSRRFTQGATLWVRRVPRVEAEAMWRLYRNATEATGQYPLLINDEHGLLTDPELTPSHGVAQLLRAAAAIDGKNYLAKRVKETLEDTDDESPGKADFNDDNGASVGPDRFELMQDPDLAKDDWWLALVPTRNPWEVFAHLGYGGWNAYPNAEEHVAVMKHWQEQHGAEPVIVTDDCIEMLVARPPVAKEACQALALEQFGYTGGDIVYQAYERFGTLSRALSGRQHWFFWWD